MVLEARVGRAGAGGVVVEGLERVRSGVGNVPGSLETSASDRAALEAGGNRRARRSSHTDRADRHRGVCAINGVDQSADQTGSAGPGSWTNSRSLTY